MQRLAAENLGYLYVQDQAADGHASDTLLSRYVRDGELFLGNAGGILL